MQLPGNVKSSHARFPNCQYSIYQDHTFPYILGLKLLALWSSIVVNVLVTLAVSICMNAARNRKTSGNSNHQCSSQVLAIVRDNSIVWALYSPVFSQRATSIASWTWMEGWYTGVKPAIFYRHSCTGHSVCKWSLCPHYQLDYVYVLISILLVLGAPYIYITCYLACTMVCSTAYICMLWGKVQSW